MLTHISIELSDEAGEIVVLEILGQKLFRELRHVPNNEAIVPAAPRHHVVRQWIVNHIVSFAQKRRNRAHRRRRRVRRRYRFANRSHSLPSKQIKIETDSLDSGTRRSIPRFTTSFFGNLERLFEDHLLTTKRRRKLSSTLNSADSFTSALLFIQLIFLIPESGGIAQSDITCRNLYRRSYQLCDVRLLN